MYIVQFRNLESGKWEEYDRYDSYPAACSMLRRASRGKAGRIIDAKSKAVRDTIDGDMGAYDQFDN